ncbi:MAG: class I SAM-dependent methyltransferase [Pyrobaculum sp.]
MHELERDVKAVIGASRLLLLPLIGLGVSCFEVGRLAQGLTVNYRVKNLVTTVGPGVGSLKEFKIPCALDLKRMPPLKRYIERGYLSRNFSEGLRYWEVRQLFRSLEALYRSRCSGDLYRVAKCLGLPIGEVKEAVAVLRLLYPSTIEVYREAPFAQRLGRPGTVFRLEDLWADLYYYIETGFIKRPSIKRVRTWANKYAIPELLEKLDFKDALVIDVGAGYGTKGAYTIRKGARYVVLIDIDSNILKSRGTGALIDKLQADARRLPLRDKSVDAAIFWNVLQFLHGGEYALGEISRVTKRMLVISVYNADGAVRHYTRREFLDVVEKIGHVVYLRNLSNRQLQAVVIYEN